MATVEEIRDIMNDEYPHLEQSIPETGRIVKFTFFDPKELYVVLEAIEDTITYNPLMKQLTVDYKLAMIGDDRQWQLTMALNNHRKDSPYSWQYV